MHTVENVYMYSLSYNASGQHDSELSSHLRLSCAFELLTQQKEYVPLIREYCFMSDERTILSEIFIEITKCIINREWTGSISIAALSTVLSRPIRLVYPILANEGEAGAYHRSALNQTFEPIRRLSDDQFDTLHILFSSATLGCFESDPANWRPNHFVLLFNPNSTLHNV